jgi:hypothetical protein
VEVERYLHAKNLRKVESNGFGESSETRTSMMADAAKMRVAGIMPASITESFSWMWKTGSVGRTEDPRSLFYLVPMA